MLPTFIRNAQEFGATVKLKVTAESVVLDFKAALHGMLAKGEARREAHKELARDIAQFANTHGGTLLIGVSEDNDKAPNIADAIVSVQDPEAARQWISQAVQNFLVPSTLSIDIKAFAVSGGTVLAVNVPAHADLVAVWDRESHAIEYLWRDGNAKAYMNPDEAERHRMDAGRANKLRLRDAMNGGRRTEVDVLGTMISRIVHGQSVQNDIIQPSGTIKIRESANDANTFELVIPIRSDLKVMSVSYAAVEAVWTESPTRIGLILRYPIVLSNDRFSLDVHPPRR